MSGLARMIALERELGSTLLSQATLLQREGVTLSEFAHNAARIHSSIQEGLSTPTDAIAVREWKSCHTDTEVSTCFAAQLATALNQTKIRADFEARHVAGHVTGDIEPVTAEFIQVLELSPVLLALAADQAPKEP